MSMGNSDPQPPGEDFLWPTIPVLTFRFLLILSGPSKPVVISPRFPMKVQCSGVINILDIEPQQGRCVVRVFQQHRGAGGASAVGFISNNRKV